MASKQEIRKQRDELFNVKPLAAPAIRGLALPASSMAAARTGQLGALRGEVTMKIQTRQAQLLLTGREPTPERPNRVMGLMAFSRYLGQVAAAAKEDDPWADWTMVLVEEKLEAAEAEMAVQQANVMRVLGSIPMIDIQVAESLEPMTVSIGFASSHAYWVARVITQYDTLVRMVLTARHTALANQDVTNLMLADAATLIRRVFEATSRYRQTQVKRTDVAAGNDLAQQAEKLMGIVPADILDKSRRAQFAPTSFTPAGNARTSGGGASAVQSGGAAVPAVPVVEEAGAEDDEVNAS
jgi:integrating conjugative element protein (TIGR03761 family)